MHTQKNPLRPFLAVLLALCLLPFASMAAETDAITFADPVVESTIRGLLEKPEGPITSADMLTIEEFRYDPINDLFRAHRDDPDFTYNPADHVFEEIQSIDDLAHCTNLRVLDLMNQPIGNIEALRGLSLLEDVSLFGCAIDSLDPLAGHKHLKRLWINNTGVRDASAVFAIDALEDFNAYWGTEIIDLSALKDTSNLRSFLLVDYNNPIDYTPLKNHANLESVALCGVDSKEFADLLASWPKLKSLDLKNSPITDDDLKLLDGLALTTLQIENCPISDLTPLATQTALEDLRITDCRVTDISPLAGLTQLSYSLDLRGNDIQDLSPLAGLENLESLCISPNEAYYSRDDVRAVLPYARVIYGPMDMIDPLKQRDGSESPAADEETEEPEVIAFTDAEVERRIRLALEKPEGAITTEDMLRVTDFVADPINEDWDPQTDEELRNPALYTFDSVMDISELAYCKNLVRVVLSYQGLESIEPLHGLENLREVSLHGCYNITDLSPLEGMRELSTVVISGVPVEDVTPVLSLPNLSTLWATWPQEGVVWDLSPLAETRQLRHFLVSQPAEDYAPLKNHKKLQTVRLYGVDSEELADLLSNWPMLTSLDVYDASITGDDLALLNNRRLYALRIANTPLGHIDALEGQKGLDQLVLENCGITDISPLESMESI